MKKVLALLLALVMCAGLLAACGSGDDGGTTSESAQTGEAPTPPPLDDGAISGDDGAASASGWVLSGDNPFEISMSIVTTETAPAEGNRIAQRMQNELGVTINYELVSPAQQDEKIGILSVGDTLPDILAYSQQKGDLIAAGTMLKMDDYLATGAYPNIYRHVEPVWARAAWRGGGVPDGLYVLPNYNRFYSNADGYMYVENEPMAMQFAIQKDVLAWHGYPDLKGITPEECFQLIIDYIAENPTVDGAPAIGFTIPMHPGQEWGLTNSPLFASGSPNDGDTRINPETGEAKIYHTDEYSYRWYKLLNEMYQLGIIDPEFDTQSEDQWFEKVANGRVLAMHHQRWAWSTPHAALLDAEMFERTYAPAVPVWADAPNPPYYLDIPVMNVQQGWSVSVTTPEPERIFTFIDTMLSEYWQIILQWGEEGIDYTIKDDGLFTLTDENRANRDDLLWKQNNRLMAFWDQMPKIQGAYPENGNPSDPGRSPEEWLANLSDYDKEFLEAYNMPNWAEFFYRSQGPLDPPYFPTWQAPLSQDAQIATDQRRDWCVEKLPAIIKCNPDDFDTLWQEFADGFDRIDIALFESEVTAFAQQRMREAGALD